MEEIGEGRANTNIDRDRINIDEGQSILASVTHPLCLGTRFHSSKLAGLDFSGHQDHIGLSGIASPA